MALAETVRARLESGLELPSLGGGSTPDRLRALFELGREDLALARLLEAHFDARQILREAGRAPREGALYGVWASEGGGARVELAKREEGLELDGAKRFCSGALVADTALVTAFEPSPPSEGSATEAAPVLLEVGLRDPSGALRPGIQVDPSGWRSPAFSGAATAATVGFERVRARPSATVGPPGWYAARPGFWHGALGPAACWAGGAAGLVDAARETPRRDPHTRAHLGALEAAVFGLLAILEAAGREVDRDPRDVEARAEARALMARHLVERLATEILDRFGRATGPRLLAFDEEVARRHAELSLYLRQCHGERDLESLTDALGGASGAAGASP